MQQYVVCQQAFDNLRSLLQMSAFYQFSEENATKMKTIYGEFCSHQKEAVSLFKELQHNKKFQNFIKVSWWQQASYCYMELHLSASLYIGMAQWIRKCQDWNLIIYTVGGIKPFKKASSLSSNQFTILGGILLTVLIAELGNLNLWGQTCPPLPKLHCGYVWFSRWLLLLSHDTTIWWFPSFCTGWCFLF